MKLSIFSCKFFSSNLFKKCSFTLIELSVALAVMGVLVGSSLTAYKATNPKMRNDLKKIQAIEKHLQQFFATNGRLPYPANPTYLNTSEYYLRENRQNIIMNSSFRTSANHRSKMSQMSDNNSSYQSCFPDDADSNCLSGNFAIWGVVPTRTLGLPDDYAYDSNGHNFEYITNSVLADKIGAKYNDNDTGNYQIKKNYVPNNNGGYGVYFESHGDEIQPQITNIDVISIKSNKTNQTIENSLNNTAYVIISKGNTNKCYWNNRGKVLIEQKPVSTSTNDSWVGRGETARDPSIVNSQNSSTTTYNCAYSYTKNSFNSLEIRQDYNKELDNIVQFSTLGALMNKIANEKEIINEITQQDIIQYQPRLDKKLETQNQSVTGAINEVNHKFQIVSSFDNVEGEENVLYYLTKESSDYDVGLYIYNISDRIFENVGGGNGDGNPVGTIIAYAGTDIPYGYLLCDGKIYNRAIYRELFNVIGEKYGSGDGSTTFKVPDLNNRFLEGTTNNDSVGKKLEAGLPNITGTFGPLDDMSGNSFGGAFYYAWGTGYDATSSWSGGGWVVGLDASRLGTVYGKSSTVQPNALMVKYLIKYTKKKNKQEEETTLPPKTLLSPQDVEFVCEASYPVGSIYMNYMDPTNPNELLKCGVWERIEAGAFLQNEGAECLSNFCKRAGITDTLWSRIRGNNTNFLLSNIPVNTYMTPGSLNITGYSRHGVRGGTGHNIYGAGGGFWLVYDGDIVSDYYPKGSYNRAWGTCGINFDASRMGSVYGYSNHVQPFSYTVYIWKRIG